MKNLTFYALICLLATTSFKKSNCSCGDLGPKDHKRTNVKDRPVSHAHATKVPVVFVLNLPISDEEKEEIKQNEDVILTAEKRLVTVTGYAWIVKVSPEDCDIHIEISATNNKNAPRIIAEIPNSNEYCDLHSRVLNDLVERFNLPSKKEYHFDKTDNDGKPIKLTVTGLLFWDNGHPTNYNHGSANVGSVWELHPVSKLEWE